MSTVLEKKSTVQARLLAGFYALDHRGRYHFCRFTDVPCHLINALSAKEPDCRICVRIALDQREDLNREDKILIYEHCEKDMLGEPGRASNQFPTLFS